MAFVPFVRLADCHTATATRLVDHHRRCRPRSLHCSYRTALRFAAANELGTSVAASLPPLDAGWPIDRAAAAFSPAEMRWTGRRRRDDAL